MSGYAGQVPDTLPRPLDWMDRAVCRADPDLMFTTDAMGVERARRVCGSCPVWRECRSLVLERREEYGTWGGLSEQERRTVWRHTVALGSGMEPVPARVLDAFGAYTLETDGHLLWRGPATVSVGGRPRTPFQLAWWAQRGCLPSSPLRGMCGRWKCVLAAHLVERAPQSAAS